MTNEEKLEQYYNMLFPKSLKENEYIRIVCMKGEEPEEVQLGEDTFVKTKVNYPIVNLVQSFQEYMEVIRKYKYNYNIFNNISTVVVKDGEKSNSGTLEHIRQRKVLFLDFDKKDYPNLIRSDEFTELVKSKVNLFIQSMVDSGNGYHMYISVKPSCRKDVLSDLNKRLIQIVGADIKAGSPTQIARIPFTQNLKDKENKKWVNIIFNDYGQPKCKPYEIKYIEQVIGFAERSVAVTKKQEDVLQEQDKRTYYSDSSKKFLCIEKMLYEGAEKGERNFCLGRIVKSKQRQGFKEEIVRKEVIDWNTRCRPPKSELEVLRDFTSYWNNDYLLLGCKLQEGTREYAILDKYCDRNLCSSVYSGEMKSSVSSGNSFILCNTIFDDKALKGKERLEGRDYLILTVLTRHKSLIREITLRKLKTLLSDTKSNKCCMSDGTLKKILKKLDELKYIKLHYNNENNYFTEDIKINVLKQRDYGKGYTNFYFSVAVMAINGLIKPHEYKVYLYLMCNVMRGNSVAYDDILKDTGIEKTNASKYVKGLHKAGAIDVLKAHNEKGYQANRYEFFSDDALVLAYDTCIQRVIDKGKR